MKEYDYILILFKNSINSYTLYENGKKISFNSPLLLEQMDKRSEFDLTLVIPAYNEENRLPTMMNDTIKVKKIIILIICNYLAFGEYN